MAHRLAIVDCMPDDISIAQRLLDRPRIPSRGASVMRPSATHRRVANASWDVPTENLASSNNESEHRRQVNSSNTWTSSSGDVLSDQDDIEERTPFVQEYNRLARKHGVRLLAPDDLNIDNIESYNSNSRPGGWFSRNILRRTSSTQSIKRTKHSRSISDLSTRLKSKKDALKDKDLQELVRLCGLSRLYLPAEYASGSLAVPTCFRATAQYLVQHATTTRGVFRIPGSHSVVNALYNHYCTLDEDGVIVAGTVRCPTLPIHIKCDVHDVASAFKRFISGLPGGILGSLPLFYTFISIQNHLQGDPESTKTKQSKVRARLIALAVRTLKSQYRRELICAVFGLLSMIGRAAETAPREDDRGRPLPTSDLMGYGPLGIVFGPLLVGDILDSYEMRLANPYSGLVLLPASPPKSRRDKHKKSRRSATDEGASFISHIDKIKVANGVTEMLITHWRDVNRHMRDLNPVKAAGASKYPFLRPSASDSFALRKPPDWDDKKLPASPLDRPKSPTPQSSWNRHCRMGGQSSFEPHDSLVVKKQRSRPRPASIQKLSNSKSMSLLSPTREESKGDLIGLFSPRGSPMDANARKQSPTPAAGRPDKMDVASLIKRKPCPKATGEVQSKSSETKTASEQPRPCASAANSQEPQPDSCQHKSPATVQPQMTSVSNSLSTEHKLSQSPSNLTVSIHLRRHASSEPVSVMSGAIKSTGQTDGRTENSRSTLAQPEELSTNSSKKKSHEQHQPPSLAVIKAISVNDSTNYSFKLRAAEDRGTTEESIILSNSHSHTATRAPIESKSSPMPRFKIFSAPNGKLPRQTLLGTDGPAVSAMHDLVVVERVFKSDNLTIEANHASDNDIENPIEKRQKPHVPVATISDSPRVSVRDLAAKFNTAASKTLFVPSPRSSPVKNSFDDFRALSEAPKDSVISPYKSNPPSPTRSQRSGKSDKSNRSLHGPMSLQDPQFTVPRRLSTPRRMVRTSTPLQSASRAIEETIPPVPSGSNGKINMEEPHRRKYSSLNFSIPRALQAPDKDTAVLDSSKGIKTFDGYESVTKFNKMLPGSGTPLPMTSCVRFASPRPLALCKPPISEPQSQTNVIFPTAPSRSNSILHGQVRALQRQLDAKMEQIRQMKHQLENKGILDIGSISEQLREAKREILLWKTRAEVAERQIEVMGKLSVNGRPSTSRIKPDAADRPIAINNQEGVVPVRKTQNALRMMDGAASPQRDSSLESSDTILHDLTVTESEFGGWAEQISMAINSNSHV